MAAPPGNTPQSWIIWGFNLVERKRVEESVCQLSHSQASPRKSGTSLGP